MNKRYLLAVELLWLFIGIFCLLISVREFVRGGKQEWIFLAMALFALLLAGIRHYQRKKT